MPSLTVALRGVALSSELASTGRPDLQRRDVTVSKTFRGIKILWPGIRMNHHADDHAR